MGALAALLAVEKGRAWEPEQPGFRAVVAYYPECQYSSGVLTAPALILVGEQDDWGLAAACRKLAAHDNDIGITRSAAAGEFIDPVIYSDATHAFDMQRPAMRWMGHLEQYNEAAATDAALRVRAFLQRELLDQAKTP